MRRTWLFVILVGCDRPATKSVPPPVASSVPSATATATAIASTPLPVVDAAAPEKGMYGDTTILTVTGPGRPMRLDGPEPVRTFTLRSKVDPTKVVATGKLDGDYRPVAYAVETHAYVMLFLGQTGAWYGIRDIALLDEQGKLRENLVPKEFFAVTDVESKDGQYVALVGKLNDAKGPTSFRLLAFDVAKARAFDVGAAPQAPPGDSEFCKGSGAQSWVEPSGIASYQPIDEGILSFEDAVLVETKGADSCKGRAKKRDTARHQLRLPSGSKSGGAL